MLLSELKLVVESFRRADGERGVGLHHIKGVHVRVIHVQLRRNAGIAQMLKIADGLGVERLAVADKGICGRQTGEILQPRRSGVRRELCAVSPAQIEPPCEMVASGVPDAAVVISR